MLLKLALIPLSVLIASLVSRHFGHSVAGVLSGLPMVAGPMIAVLMIDHDASTVAPITTATVSTIPATLAYFVAFAWLARRHAWWMCLAGGALVFAVVGWTLSGMQWPPLVAIAIALGSPWLALAAMPQVEPLIGAAPVPASEIVLRMVFAAAVGAAILYGAGHFPPRVNGLLLSWPVTGTILPSFTLLLHGSTAAINLLRGYAVGLIGFAIFFCALDVMLRAGLNQWPSFVTSVVAAALVAAATHRWRRRVSAVNLSAGSSSGRPDSA